MTMAALAEICPDCDFEKRLCECNKLVYHGRTVICSNYCGDRCTLNLWICEACLYIECETCSIDYNGSLPKRKFEGNFEGWAYCRGCGRGETLVDFLRTDVVGINVVTTKEWRKTGLKTFNGYSQIQRPLEHWEIWQLLPKGQKIGV